VGLGKQTKFRLEALEATPLPGPRADRSRSPPGKEQLGLGHAVW